MKKKFTIALLLCVCAIFCAFGIAACDSKVEVTSITLDKTELALDINEEAKLTATVLPDDATDKNVVWTVDDSRIAEVNYYDGTVRAFSEGVTVVTATAGSVSAKCTVTVTRKIPVDWISILEDEVVLFGNGEKTLDFRVYPEDTTSSLTWSVEPEGVVKVENGKLTALAQGSAVVKASADRETAECKVIVSEDGFEYLIQDDGLNYYVASNYAYEGLIDSEFFTDVEIASEFNGKPVNEISPFAFSEISIKSLKIPASVTKIGTRYLGFQYELESIDVDEKNENYASVDGVLYNKSVTECLCVPQGKSTVTIPETMTKITDKMFYDRTNLTNVKMHDGIVAIGEWAFFNCINLNSIVITENITEIGSAAFSGCINLWEIYNLSSHLRIDIGDYENNGGIGIYALDIKYMKDFPSDIDKRSDGFTFFTARDNKAYLVGYTGEQTELVLPANYNGNTYEINKKAFYCNSKLTEVIIYEGVTAIGDNAFLNCENLESVTISASLEKIGEEVFSACDKLTNVIIGEGVTEIGVRMFNNCKNLKTVTILGNVTRIQSGAFWDCESLTDIYFEGTIEQWNAINKWDNWDLGTGGYTVHCTDGDVEKSNN